MEQIKLKSDGFDIELNLRSHTTVLLGDSATGKSFFYDLMTRVDGRDDIMCINYETVRPKANYEAILNAVKNSKHKLIIIDQADDIQRKDDSLMYAINTDYNNNKYIIIGRNPKVLSNISDMAEISIKDNKITLQYMFPEPLI